MLNSSGWNCRRFRCCAVSCILSGNSVIVADGTCLKSDGALMLTRLRPTLEVRLKDMLVRMDEARETSCLPSIIIRDGSDDAGRGMGGGEVGLGRLS